MLYVSNKIHKFKTSEDKKKKAIQNVLPTLFLFARLLLLLLLLNRFSRVRLCATP